MKRAMFKGGEFVHLSCMGEIVSARWSDFHECWKYTLKTPGGEISSVPEVYLIREEDVNAK